MMVMWVFLFVLVAMNDVEATDDDCSKDTSQLCNLSNARLFFRRMSSKGNTMNCKNVVETLECIVRVEEKCHFDDEFLNLVKQSLPYIKDGCRELLPELPSNDTDTNEASEEDEDCRVPTAIACKMSDLEDSGGSPHDRCRTRLAKAECFVRVEEKCHFDEYFLKMAKNQLSLLNRVCGRERQGVHTIGGPEDDGDCSVPTAVTCKMSDVLNLDGSLHDRCRILLAKAECVVRVEEKCHFNDYILKKTKNQLPDLKRICGREREGIITGYQGPREKGNTLWTSMNCIKNVLQTETEGYCVSTPCKFKLIKYAEALIKKEIISHVDVKTLLCIGQLNVFTCLAVTIENKCGNFAFKQYIKVMESMPETIMSNCEDLHFNDVFPTMVEVYKENESAENLLRSVLKTSGL